jgi:transcriptional regulator with XRE-family HTH domain
MKYNFKKLRDRRVRHLLTLTDVAEMTGLSVTAVREVENGKFWKKAIRTIEGALNKYERKSA